MLAVCSDFSHTCYRFSYILLRVVDAHAPTTSLSTLSCVPSSNAVLMMPDRTLYFSAIIACLTAALFGYSVGFIGGLIVLPSFLYSFGLDILGKAELASAQSRVVTVWLVGALLGVPLGMPVCSRLGRKKCLGFSALLYVLGTVLQVASSKGGLHLFELGRFLNGLGVGAGTLVSPM